MVTTPQQAATPVGGGPGDPGGPDDTGTDDIPPAPSYEPMSIKGPAFIVLGLAVVILLGGVAAAALTTTTNPTFTIQRVTLSDGTNVALVPATHKFHAIISDGEPPDDIMGNIGIPSESKIVATVNSDQGTAQFDRTVKLTSQLAQSQVSEAYHRMLTATGWKVIFQGSAPQSVAGSTEVLATHGSSDGFYWEIGVVVSPTTATGFTPYSVEIFETPDGN
jgi:hypothetical protein